MTAKTAKSAPLGWSGMFRGFSTGPTTRNVGLKAYAACAVVSAGLRW
jgi:hypothetical protein